MPKRNEITVTMFQVRKGVWKLQYTHPTLKMPSGLPKKPTKSVYGSKSDADRERLEWQDVLNGRKAPQSSRTWCELRERFTSDVLDHKARETKIAYTTAMNYFENLSAPSTLAMIDTEVILAFRAALLNHVESKATANKHLRSIRRVIRYGRRIGWNNPVPHFEMFPETDKAKSDPVTEKQFVAMLRATRRVVGKARARAWRELLIGLWLSGLRLSEALALRWEQDSSKPHVSGDVLWLPASSQKNRKDQHVPLSPMFVDWLAKRRKASGYVFNPVGEKGGRLTANDASRKIAAIGRKAKAVVGPDQYAGAHSLRRSFGTIWSDRVMPQLLQKMMRHATFNTTQKFYAKSDAHREAAILRQLANQKLTDGRISKSGESA